MKASEPKALEVRLQGPIGLHIGCGLYQTVRPAVVTTAVQPSGGSGTDCIGVSTFPTHLQLRQRSSTITGLFCSWMLRIASDSLRTQSLVLLPSIEARGPPLSASD